MFKYLVLFALVGLAWSAPAPAPKPLPVANPPLSVISEIKTPASTAKLTARVAPIGLPISHFAFLPESTSYVYVYPNIVTAEKAIGVSTYSIDEHGYHIIH